MPHHMTHRAEMNFAQAFLYFKVKIAHIKKETHKGEFKKLKAVSRVKSNSHSFVGIFIKRDIVGLNMILKKECLSSKLLIEQSRFTTTHGEYLPTKSQQYPNNNHNHASRPRTITRNTSPQKLGNP